MNAENRNRELALNLWAYLDQGMGLVYAVAGKAYALTGSEEEKLAVLHKLAATDFISVKRQSVLKNFRLLDGEHTQEGIVAASTRRENAAQVFEGVIQSIEAELPPIPKIAKPTNTRRNGFLKTICLVVRSCLKMMPGM